MRLLIPTLVLLLSTLTVNAQLLSDNFDDGVPDVAKWTIGTGFNNDAVNYYPTLVPAVESGPLTFTHPGSLAFWAGNAYMSQSTFDLRGTRSSAYLDPTGGLSVWLAVGQDPTHHARIIALAGADGSFFAQCDYWNGNKIWHTVCIQPVDYAPGYLAIRIQGNKVVFESSADGLNWSPVGSVNGANIANPARIEVGGGGFFPFGSTITGYVDNLLVE